MTNLRIPGPTPLPPQVLKSLSKQMINHRGKSYEEIHERVIKNLKVFFQTKNDIFLLTSSGMGGLEAAVANFFSPGDRIVSFTVGEFGQRWADVARAYGADVLQVKFPLGTAVTIEKVKEVLAKEINVKGVFVTLNETATGVLSPVAEIGKIVKADLSGPLFLVDSISSLGAVNCSMDKIGIDVLVTASQKAWMAPPGISMIAVSPKAWEAHKKAKNPRYYFDISLFKKFAEKNQTPATPAVSVIYALDTALQMMVKVGKEKVFKKHLELMKYTREKISKMGLQLFVSDKDASPTVTSIKVPEGVDAHDWLGLMKKKYDVVLAGGMGETKGKIIRIAHMGFVSKKELDEALDAIRESLKEMHVNL
jgi:aspartate aminotransferase-like enzyme